MHGIDASLPRRLVALVELGMHGLHDHDGVIHHNSDGEHQRREREEVEREAEEVQHKEGTHQRHRYGDGGDQRGAQVLQEEVDHDEDQEEGLQQRLDDVLDRGLEEVRDVHDVLDLHTGREVLL